MFDDNHIIEGLRRGDSHVFREFFYPCCMRAYFLFDARYGLSKKQNLDFMSLAHQYAIYLMEHDWRPLMDRSPNVSLSTWMTNGFRYIVLDALKWYKREFGSLTFEDHTCHAAHRRLQSERGGGTVGHIAFGSLTKVHKPDK